MPTYNLSKTSFGARFKRTKYNRYKRRMPVMLTRRPRGLRASRLLKYNVHSYKRMATPVTFTATYPTAAYNNSFSFSLSEVRGAGELTALYDQYMITGVKVTFQLINNPDANTAPFTNTTNLSNVFPKLFYVRDYDDTGVEATNDLRERNNVQVKVLRPNSLITVFLRPAVRNQLYLDGITAANSPLWKQWLDCSSSTVPHYGMKFSVDFAGFNTQSDYQVRVEKTFYLKFKNAR